MKYKNKIKNLLSKQRWYDSQSESYKKACKRPGSVKG
jgi:hypothetical protein